MSDLRSVEEKVAAYREKYPERVALLNAAIAPLLGIHARTKLSAEAVGQMCQPVVDKVIAGCWGLE